MHTAYYYPHSITKFNFIIIGTLKVKEIDDITVCDYTIVYHIPKNCIILLSSLIVEGIVNSQDTNVNDKIELIDDYTLSNLLYNCLSINLGYINHKILKLYVKHHVECRESLITFLNPLIKSTWTITQVKEELNMLKFDCTSECTNHCTNHYSNNDITDMMKTILDDLLLEEAKRRQREKVATLIQTKWREVISNPYHPICKRRLLREASELITIQ